MIAFQTVVADVVEALTAAGIKATADAADVRFPGVWVGGVSADVVTLGGGYEYAVDLYLVDQRDGGLRTYGALDDLATQVESVFDLADDRALDVTSVNLPSAPMAPAYRFPITIIH